MVQVKGLVLEEKFEAVKVEGKRNDFIKLVISSL